MTFPGDWEVKRPNDDELQCKERCKNVVTKTDWYECVSITFDDTKKMCNMRIRKYLGKLSQKSRFRDKPINDGDRDLSRSKFRISRFIPIK